MHGYERLDIQRSVYSGYLRDHGLKAQVVLLPIGIMASVYVAEMRQNDNGVQNMSGLNDYLVRLLQGRLIGGLLPCLFCDGIFAVLAAIVPRFPGETEDLQLLNMKLSSLREVNEHIFTDHKTLFQLFDRPRYQSLFMRGVTVRRLFTMSFFIQNCYICIRGGSLPHFWAHPPSTG